MSKIASLLSEIRSIDPSELTDTEISSIFDTYKTVFAVKQSSAARSLSVGDHVKFKTRSGETFFATVEKFNRKTVSVTEINGWGSWRVSPSMLTPITDEQYQNLAAPLESNQ